MLSHLSWAASAQAAARPASTGPSLSCSPAASQLRPASSASSSSSCRPTAYTRNVTVFREQDLPSSLV